MEANNLAWQKYTKINMLGSSQFGTAFKARTKNGQIVTVKINIQNIKKMQMKFIKMK